jgi:hypothetical protein
MDAKSKTSSFVPLLSLGDKGAGNSSCTVTKVQEMQNVAKFPQSSTFRISSVVQYEIAGGAVCAPPVPDEIVVAVTTQTRHIFATERELPG